MGHPSKFQRLSRLGFVTAVTSLNGSQPNFARCLAVSWAGTLYIHFGGCCPRYVILPGAIFTLRPSLALSCIGSVTALLTVAASINNSPHDRHCQLLCIYTAISGRRCCRMLVAIRRVHTSHLISRVLMNDITSVSLLLRMLSLLCSILLISHCHTELDRTCFYRTG